MNIDKINKNLNEILTLLNELDKKGSITQKLKYDLIERHTNPENMTPLSVANFNSFRPASHSMFSSHISKPLPYTIEQQSKYPIEQPSKYPIEQPAKYPIEQPAKYPNENDGDFVDVQLMNINMNMPPQVIDGI